MVVFRENDVILRWASFKWAVKTYCVLGTKDSNMGTNVFIGGSICGRARDSNE